MLITINTTDNNLPWFNAKGTDRIIQNVKNILNTYKYEVAYNRNLGMSPDIIDGDKDTIESLVINDLYDNIKRYEPRATLKAVSVKEITADGRVIAEIEIEI